MGTQNVRYGENGNLILIEREREKQQIEIDNSKTIDERRQLGQFSTPIDLANEIVNYGLSLVESNDINFLEPALGTGAFFSALLMNCRNEFNIRATGIEIDPLIYKSSLNLWENQDINIINGDFTEITPQTNDINFLICNPPYVRHQLLGQTQKKFLQSKVKKELGISISGLSGLYCYFILLANKWLSNGAICGWLIPSEFMDVNYGYSLKKFLLNNVHLLRIHRYNPDSSKFHDALVSSCVIWYKKEQIQHDYPVTFSYGGTHEEPEVIKEISKSTLEKEDKWTRFPINGVRESKVTTTIGDYFTVKRGIATGDNNFFIFKEKDIDKEKFPRNVFQPILPPPRKLKDDIIRANDIGDPVIDNPLYLLNVRLSEDEVRQQYPELWDYLLSGKHTTATKYLCKNRKVWYFQEQRNPSPFLCSYMGRSDSKHTSPFRFILNYSNAIATNSYLMLYPNDLLQNRFDNDPGLKVRVWHILNDINAEDLSGEGRIYGGGLNKIEPRELSKVRVPDLYSV
jgi:adenine-specific DNA-methyltransferase